jgi:predicted aspartyl protease
MNALRQIFYLALLALTSTTVFGETQCPGNIVPVRYHSVGRSYISISVSLNHSGPYDFLVDTGSEATIIEPSLATELQLETKGTADVVTGLRHTKSGVVAPEIIEVGSHAFYGRLLSVASVAQFQAQNRGIRGILGEDLLMDFDLLIDRGKKILCLDPAKDMRRSLRGERVSIVRQGSEDGQLAQAILVPVQLSSQKAQTMYLRLDSGASDPILYVDPSEKEPWAASARMLSGNVIGGSTIFFKTMPPEEVHIGNKVLGDVTFAAPVGSKKNVRFAGEDGLLPTSLFKRAFISYREEFIVLDPR